MCLLSVIPPKAIMSEEDIRKAFRANQDGWGIAYIRDGRVRIEKQPFGLSKLLRTAEKVWNRRDPATDVVFHVRLATHGRRNPDNTHPFLLPGGAAAAHNGIFSGFGNSVKSDTREWLEKVLLPWVENEPIRLGNPVNQTRFDELAQWSKVAVLLPTGRTAIANERMGTRGADGIWHSNMYWKYERLSQPSFCDLNHEPYTPSRQPYWRPPETQWKSDSLESDWPPSKYPKQEQEFTSAPVENIVFAKTRCDLCSRDVDISRSVGADMICLPCYREFYL